MKTLLILRHAKSSWSNSGLSDYERPLNERGKTTAPRMGKLLQEKELTPDLIISSSAERALKTAEFVALHSGYAREIQLERKFYLAPPAMYIAILNSVDDENGRVMVVGHNSGVEDLIHQLTGRWERMPTATLGVVQLPIHSWSELAEDTAGTLLHIWRPKELKR